MTSDEKKTVLDKLQYASELALCHKPTVEERERIATLIAEAMAIITKD